MYPQNSDSMKVILTRLHMKEGLIVHYDKLNNIGYGMEHDPMLMQWVPVCD